MRLRRIYQHGRQRHSVGAPWRRRGERIARTSIKLVSLLLLVSFLPGCDILTVGSASGRAGETVTLGVSFSTGAAGGPAGVEHRLTLDAVRTPVAVNADGLPDCTPNSMLDFSRFAFLPPSCTPGVDCSQIKAILMSSELTPLQGSTLLYSCRIRIAPGTPVGRYAIGVQDVRASSEYGRKRGATAYGGYIDVIQ
jgi:hypothetical protein